MTPASQAGALVVVSPGIGATIQDGGRPGWQRFGVPVSGALDRVGLAAANIVVGNPPTAAAIECLYTGITLSVDAAPVRIAVAGAGCSIEIASSSGAKRSAATCESVTLNPGDHMTVRRGPGSIAAYLAASGGIDVPLALGSRSTYLRAALGGVCGRRLEPGDRLQIGASPADAVSAEHALPGIDLSARDRVRVVLGPQDDRFTARAVETLRSATYTVTSASDRMGLRLDGPRLEHTDGADILSDGIPPGAIQVPGSGLPIIMLADRQTTGGYTKIATVVSADLPLLGRIGPGARLGFDIVDIDTAEGAARTLAAEIAAWPARLVPVTPSAADLSTRLHGANLVSGVVDAARPCTL